MSKKERKKKRKRRENEGKYEYTQKCVWVKTILTPEPFYNTRNVAS